MNAAEVKDHIRTAFPAVPYFGSVTACDCEECTEIRDGLGGKQWDEVPASFLDYTCSPVMLTPEAFAAFLPAYLLRGLDGLSERSVVLEFTVYDLCPSFPEEDDPPESVDRVTKRLLDRVSVMSRAQVEAIREFLAFVRQNCGNPETFEPVITEALEQVWR